MVDLLNMLSRVEVHKKHNLSGSVVSSEEIKTFSGADLISLIARELEEKRAHQLLHLTTFDTF